MHEVEVVLVLLVATTALSPLSRKFHIPYPILLVLVGLALALLPAVPHVELAPGLVFLLFLPPLLYVAAFDTSIREIKAVLPRILSLSVGLTLATTIAVAWVAQMLMPDLGWATAFALGAIVSPPDAVAATAVMRRVGAPRQLVTLLEGESLFNDATALVAYEAALAAIATSTFSIQMAGLQFVLVAFGGIAVGLLVGYAIGKLRQVLHDTAVEITISLLTPFAAWLAAEALHVSGVLAVVVSGLSLGWWAPRIMDANTRLRGRAVWELLVFVLQGLVFILLGLQLSSILPTLSGDTLPATLGFAAAISITVIVVRLAWVAVDALFTVMKGHNKDWRRVFVIGWSGMRGVVSLAAALALPFSIPQRDLLIVTSFAVILVTLVGQGLSLPFIIRALGLVEDGEDQDLERSARLAAVEAAQARISTLSEEWPSHLPLIETLNAQYSHRATHLVSHNDSESGLDGDGPVQDEEQEELEHRHIRREVIAAERNAVLDLRISGGITDDVWRRIERDLDLEALRMDA